MVKRGEVGCACGVCAKGLPEPGVSGVGPLPYQTPEGVGPPLFRGGPVAPEGAPALDRNCRNGHCEHHSSHTCTAAHRRSQAFALSAHYLSRLGGRARRSDSSKMAGMD